MVVTVLDCSLIKMALLVIQCETYETQTLRAAGTIISDLIEICMVKSSRLKPGALKKPSAHQQTNREEI